MGIGALAAAEAGAEGPAVLDELNTWFVPLLVAGAFSFAIGAAGLALAIRRSGLLVMPTARFVPWGAALCVGGAADVVALLPLAHRMRSDARASAGAGQAPSLIT